MLFPLLSLFLFFLLVRAIWRGIEHWWSTRGERKERRERERAEHAEKRDNFLDHVDVTWYQVVVIFAVGSFAGLILEQVWMFITEGLTEHRYGLVWGPFSPLYGVGAVILTILCYQLRRRGTKSWQIFLISMVVGGGLEQITGWTMETVMGAVSWDYSAWPGAISKWVCLPFCVMWGVLGLFWATSVMPELLYRIGVPTRERQVTFVGLLAVYLAFDIFMTLACFGRLAERERGVAPSGAFEEWIDEHYSDEFIANRFQNMVIEGITS